PTAIAAFAVLVVGLASAAAGDGPVATTPTTAEPPAAEVVGSPTPSPAPCACSVLIVYADTHGPPDQLQSALWAEPGISSVTLFDGNAATPTLTQLQGYDIVVPYSNSPFANATTLGNNLADYVDGGGVVVQMGFCF